MLPGISHPPVEVKRHPQYLLSAARAAFLAAALFAAAPARAQAPPPEGARPAALAFADGPRAAAREGARVGVRVFAAYPNPAADDLTVRFLLERAQRVELSVFDLLGRRLRGWDLGVLAAGEQAHRLDLAGLPPGLYVVRLTGDAGARATVKVTRRPSA